MSIASKLEYLDGTKDYIKQCIQQKGVAIPEDTTFRQYGDKILEISTSSEQPPSPSSVLQEGTAKSTGKDFDLLPSEGYDGFSKVKVLGDYNLKPENIAAGITIYGVTGILNPRPQYDTTIPSVYQPYFDQARELYIGDYKNVMILESDTATAVGFLLDGFTVQSYDETTTEFTALKWVYVAYNKQTQEWKVEEHIDAVSGGNTFIKNIRFSDTYIYYGSRILYPFILDDTGEINDSWDEIVASEGAPYPIGSWKELTIGTIDGVDYGRVQMKKVYNGESGTKSTWLSQNVLWEPKVFDPDTTNSYVIGGWAACELRAWLNGTFFNALPYALSSTIKSVNKYTRVCGENKVWIRNDQTNDKIWVPSRQEILGSSDVSETDGVRYSSASMKLTNLKDGEAKIWWMRSTINSPYGIMSSVISGLGQSRAASCYETGVYVSFGFCL